MSTMMTLCDSENCADDPLEVATSHRLGGWAGRITAKACVFAPEQIRLCRNRVVVNCDFADDPVSRKSTMALVAQIGVHTVRSGSKLQILTALSVGEMEFCAVVKGGQLGPSLGSVPMDLGIP